MTDLLKLKDDQGRDWCAMDKTSSSMTNEQRQTNWKYIRITCHKAKKRIFDLYVWCHPVYNWEVTCWYPKNCYPVPAQIAIQIETWASQPYTAITDS